MNDMPLPDELADGIVAGNVQDGPAELAAVAQLFATAAQPATADELAGLAAVRAGFVAAPLAAVGSSRTGRISRRAIAAVAGVLLTAGTAAATAGVLTSDPEPPALTTAVDDETSTSAADESPSTSENTDEEAPEVDEETEVDDETEVGDDDGEGSDDGTDEQEAQGPDATGPAAYGLCTAWGNGAPKNTDNPAFGALVAAAEAAGLTVDEYCADVVADKETGRGDDPDTPDDGDEEEPIDDDADDPSNNGQGNNGDNGNGDNGQGNNGNGNNGNGNKNGRGGQNGND